MLKLIRINIYHWLIKQTVYHRSKQMGLLEMIEESRLSWLNARNEFNLGDREVIEYLIYKINAAEKRYMVLLNQARAQGITAWPVERLKPVVLTVSSE